MGQATVAVGPGPRGYVRALRLRDTAEVFTVGDPIPGSVWSVKVSHPTMPDRLIADTWATLIYLDLPI